MQVSGHPGKNGHGIVLPETNLAIIQPCFSDCKGKDQKKKKKRKKKRTWYSVLDLKDSFFCLRLLPSSQLIFAFEWRDPETRKAGQLTWTRLPQWFKNSPTLSDKALHCDLAPFLAKNPHLTLLQYVDDLLLAVKSESDCLQGTERLLTDLSELGYRVSAKKVQLCQT